MTTQELTLERLVQQAQALYSLPTVAMQVLELTSNPAVDAGKLKACIERDPALTTKLLRVVNSSLFGLSQQVSDLNQALALLGIKPLKLLVLGFSLPDALFTDVAGDVLGRYWKRTLTRAVAAREVSERVWQQPGDEAFIAGLLEDLGMLVLIQEVGKPYVELLTKVTASGDYLTALERHALGFDHVQLTARLLAQWKLPASLVEAVAPREMSEPTADAASLPRILHLAGLLTLLLAEERTDLLPVLLRLGQTYHRLTPEQLEELVAEVQNKVGQLADVLSLTLPDGLNYADVLEVAHEQLVQVAADAAGDLVRSQHESMNAQLDNLLLLDEVRQLSAAVSKTTQPRKRAVPAPVPVRAAAAPRATGKPIADASHDTDVDPGFLGQLMGAVGVCRQARCALSLLLIEMDDYAGVVFTHGLPTAQELLSRVEAACRVLDHPHALCTPVRNARFALVLPNCDRRQAVDVAVDLVRTVRDLEDPEHGAAITVSIGSATVALPPRNFPPEELVHSADRCLAAAQRSGGDGVKSIEIY